MRNKSLGAAKQTAGDAIEIKRKGYHKVACLASLTEVAPSGDEITEQLESYRGNQIDLSDKNNLQSITGITDKSRIKRIWFLNQNSYMPEDGPHIRHYALGKYLSRNGYEPHVFAANELHHVGRRIDTGGADYVERISKGVHFYYIRTTHYDKNDFRRVLNILSYYKNVFNICREIAERYGPPDVIYASSMYPTALVAGIKMAKKYGVKCICEHRDIIPDGFITKGTFKENGIIARAARWFMKRTYVKADAIVFTMEGGPQYLIDQKLDKSHGGKVDMSKVFYINNGVDLEQSRSDAERNVILDVDLDNPALFKVVYLGSIRFLNKMSLFLDAARELKEMDRHEIKILMWGTGTNLDEMRKQLKEEGLDNLVLKGYIDKKYIPGIAKRANLFIGTGNSSLMKYGMSFNKLFDYLAAGKPIILPFKVGHSIVEGNRVGVEMDGADGKSLAEEIIRFADMEKADYEGYCDRSRALAEVFSYEKLADQLEDILKEVN